MNIFKLQSEVWEIAEEKGWHEKEVSFGEFISNCHAELSEAFEVYRREGDSAISAVTPFRSGEQTSQGKEDVTLVEVFETFAPEGIPIELADVFMRILDYCETHGINMEKAITQKMAFNKTREHRHGGKIL